MRHPIVEAVLASTEVRKVVVPKLVEACFARILGSRFRTDVAPRTAFLRQAVACVLASDEPMAAFVGLRRANQAADGAIFDALVAVYLNFDRHVSALLSSRAAADRWRGPVGSPCIVAVGYGGTPVLHLAVPTAGLEPYALSVVALLEDGVPRRAAGGTIEWTTLPWHRIQAVVGTEHTIDPEVKTAQAYVAGLLTKPPPLPETIVIREARSARRVEEARSMVEFFDALLAKDTQSVDGTLGDDIAIRLPEPPESDMTLRFLAAMDRQPLHPPPASAGAGKPRAPKSAPAGRGATRRRRPKA